MDNNIKNITWPGWETVRLIGRGSFGAVYEIQRSMAGEREKAALKLISIPRDESEIYKLRQRNYTDEDITEYFTDYKIQFEKEYAMMVKMKGHANIVYCDDIQAVRHDDGLGWDIYIKMELLEPLRERIKSGLSEAEIIKLGKDICNALIYCEKMHVVHRDIKPHNIFVSKDGSYKLGDFGIAKTMEGTGTGTVTGTPEFMAPEITNTQHYDNTADIYSLGMTLYYMLNEQTDPFLEVGKKPVPSKIKDAYEKRVAGKPLPAPKHGSEKLKDIVLKACAFAPEDRYQSAADMLAELNRLDSKNSGVISGRTISTVGTGTAGGTSTTGTMGGTVGPQFTGGTVGADTGGTVGPGFTGGGTKGHATPPPPPPKKPLWLIVLAIIAIIVVGFVVMLNVHIWTPATALGPEHCKICGKVRDNTQECVEHKMRAATCTEPKTCYVCGATEGTPKKHEWIEYSFSNDMYCKNCGIRKGGQAATTNGGGTSTGNASTSNSSTTTRPSSWDLNAIGSPIEKPSNYLPQYEFGYIWAPGGNSVYGYYRSDAKGTSNIYFYPADGELVTVLAVENGRACVIVQSSQKACWVNNDYVIRF